MRPCAAGRGRRAALDDALGTRGAVAVAGGAMNYLIFAKEWF